MASVKDSLAALTIVSTIPGSAPISVITVPAASVAADIASAGEPPPANIDSYASIAAPPAISAIFSSSGSIFFPLFNVSYAITL